MGQARKQFKTLISRKKYKEVLCRLGEEPIQFFFFSHAEKPQTKPQKSGTSEKSSLFFQRLLDLPKRLGLANWAF